MAKKFKLKISQRLLKKKVRKQGFLAPKGCRFCVKVDQAQGIDYKNIGLLRAFVTERGKILPSRVSGNCSFHQRQIAHEVKTARMMALLPYCPVNY